MAQQPGRRTDTDDEHAGGHRVEGAGVPHPPRAGQATQPGDDVV